MWQGKRHILVERFHVTRIRRITHKYWKVPLLQRKVSCLQVGLIVARAAQESASCNELSSARRRKDSSTCTVLGIFVGSAFYLSARSLLYAMYILPFRTGKDWHMGRVHCDGWPLWVTIKRKSNDVLDASVLKTTCWRALKQNARPCSCLRCRPDSLGEGRCSVGGGGSPFSVLPFGQSVPPYRYEAPSSASDTAALAGGASCTTSGLAAWRREKPVGSKPR